MISPPSTVQTEERSPGDIIIQAIRAVESGDSSLLVQWRQELESEGQAQSAPSSQVMAEAALGLAVSAWATYRYEEAEERLGRLVEGLGPTDPVAPFAWIVQGEIEAAQARLLQAEQAFSQALAVSEELGMTRARAWSLIRLANVRGRLTGTPDASARLLATAEPLLDPDDDFLRGQFHCGRAGNDPTGVWTTEADARAGLDFALKAGVRRLHAACLHVLAADQIRRGRALDALDTFREEQDEQKAIGDRSGRAATLQWAGYVLFTLGDFATSRSYLLEAVSEGEASGNLSPVAWAYLSLSGIAAGLGNLAGAAEYLDEAERLLAEQGDQWGLSTLRGRRAVVAFAAGDWETARGFWNTTLEEHERSGNVVGALGAQTGLLELAIAEGDLDAADRGLAAARSAARNSGMGQWEVSFLFHEAEIALQRGDAAGAQKALEQFLLPGQFSVRTYMAQARFAEALALEGRITEAADVLESSLDSLEAWRSGLDPAGLQIYAFQIGEHVADPDLGIASVLSAMVDSGQVRRAFDLAERQRARYLYERMVLAEIGRDREVEDSEGGTSIPSPPSSLQATGVLAAIPDNQTAIVEFVTGKGGEPTTAFLLVGGGIEAVVLPPVDSLERDIGLLRSLAESGGDPGPPAKRLGSVLFEPLLRYLPEGLSSLVLVPSGSLHRIPFDLLEPTPEGPLLQRYAVSVVPSASVLSHLWQGPDPRSPSFLVLGDPALPLSRTEREGFPQAGADGGPLRSLDMDGLPRLPGASREARAVARFGRPGQVRLGADASEAFLKAVPLEEFGVIHLATHALVDESSAAGSRIILSPGEGEDGLLSPGDIGRMNFGAGLVVLSACRSAAGQVVRGEGVQGLTAPFLQAGAESVLATQWAIEDRAGHRLIRDFYDGLAEGSTVGEALRGAKLASFDRGDPPTVWAAFTVVGDASARVQAVKPRSWLPPVALGSVLVGAGLAGVWVRRRRRA